MAKSSGKGGSRGGGRQGSGGKSTPMTQPAASRVQSAGDRNPDSPTGRTGFGPRAQSAAATNDANDQDDDVA